jgi:hypothetical protein
MKNNPQANSYKGLGGRLEAVIVLLFELLPSNNPSSEKAKEKAAVALVEGGASITQAAKLLSMHC